MQGLYTFIGEYKDDGQRVDLFLSAALPDKSRSFVQKLIASGEATVNGNVIKANYRLKEGDSVAINIPLPDAINIAPENIQLDILYEDNHIIVVNKPQGMVVHPAPGHYSSTLVNALMYHCRENLSGINGVLRPGIVHRIDKDTSGVLVAAKSDMAHQSLSAQFKAHSIQRIYEAVTIGVFKEDAVTIDHPIGRHHTDRKKMCITDKNSRNAVTHLKVLERFHKYTHIEAKLETGRTHQIRVHCASIGHSLLGDTVYGSAKQPYKLQGQALHARILGFVHPLTETYMEFDAELPAYFETLLDKLRRDH